MERSILMHRTVGTATQPLEHGEVVFMALLVFVAILALWVWWK